MEKIDLKQILSDEINRVVFPWIDNEIEDDTQLAQTILEVMSITWNTAVDECKKEVKVKIRKMGINGSYSQTKDSFSKYDLKDAISASIDEDSIEQVKNMIL